MSFHEVENLTEFLDEVKLKMLNITGSSNKNIIEISDYVLANPGKFIRTQLVFIYGSVTVSYTHLTLPPNREV